MLKTTVNASLICFAAMLVACSETDPAPIVLSNITTIESDDIVAEDTQTQEDEQSQLNTDATTLEAPLFDATYFWQLDELPIDGIEDTDFDLLGWQATITASNDDNTLICKAYSRFHENNDGLSTEFTKLTGNSGNEFISVNDFDAENGPAKEYLAAFTQENGVQVNSIGRYYYLPASQLSYGITTSRFFECGATASLYAAYEDRMRTIMAGISFQEVPELENLIGEDWSGLSSVESGKLSRLRFRNRSDVELAVYWIDFDGVRELLGRVAAGNSLGLDSSEDHLIVVVDPSGIIVGQFRTSARDSLAVIR